MKLLTTSEFADVVRLHPKTVAKNAVALGGRKFGKEWRFPPVLMPDVELPPKEGICHFTDAEIPDSIGANSAFQDEKRYADLLARKIQSPRKSGTTGRKPNSGAKLV